MTREQIEERIATLTKQRDEYVIQAKSAISRVNGQIDILRELLVEPKPDIHEVKKKEKAG